MARKAAASARPPEQLDNLTLSRKASGTSAAPASFSNDRTTPRATRVPAPAATDAATASPRPGARAAPAASRCSRMATVMWVYL